MQICLWYKGLSGCATQQNLTNGSDKEKPKAVRLQRLCIYWRLYRLHWC